MNKPIPKSLHTVSVLVAVAKTTQHYAQSYRDAYNGYKPSLQQLEQSIDYSLQILSLSGSPDVYSLRDQAVRNLWKEISRV
jgi:hypothetical protein